ncbi:MAG: methyltransferase [Rikenellaceae bacterium]
MKVGTDGVLLGAWSKITGDEELILDIGSGSGVVSLMMAQRSRAKVVGVEIEEQSYLQSQENIAASPWSERVSVVNSAIQEFTYEGLFDVIVSNPPFFRSSLKSPNSQRSVARHADSLEIKELIAAVARLLSPQGRFTVVLPIEESRSLDIESCGVLYLTRRCSVVTQRGKEAKRMLSEYQLTPSTTIENQVLTIREGGEYSSEYRALTQQFYQEF